MNIKEFNDFDRAEFRNDVIVIETSSNFANEEPYMKIYAGNIPFEFMAKTTKMCRLSFVRPFVFGCKDEDLILTKEIIDNIIIGLNSKPKLISLDGKQYNTVWESLISDINYIHHDNLDEDIDKDFIIKDIPMNLPIPDYYQLLPEKGKR